MRVFRPIVEATTNLVAIDVADLAHRSGIGAKPVGDDAPRAAIFLHDALQNVWPAPAAMGFIESAE
jgi:hypothetical protein